LLPLCGGHRRLAIENLALSQQLAVYKRTAARPLGLITIGGEPLPFSTWKRLRHFVGLECSPFRLLTLGT
jgi:hypothetical protein